MTTISSKTVLAKAPADCCAEGFSHTGEPRGTIITLAGVDTYVSQPHGTSNGNCILYFPNVHEFFTNAFLIMDAMAARGYLVLGIDYFRGEPIWKSTKAPFSDAKFDVQEWTDKHMPFCKEIVPKWVIAANEKYSSEGKMKLACVGYCWGAPFVCDQLAGGGSCIAGAFAHPANLQESHFSNLERRTAFLSLAQNDFMFDRESRRKAIAIMEDKGKPFHVQLFSGISHGFALRGNMADPRQRWAKECSLNGIMDWAEHFLV